MPGQIYTNFKYRLGLLTNTNLANYAAPSQGKNWRGVVGVGPQSKTDNPHCKRQE